MNDAELDELNRRAATDDVQTPIAVEVTAFYASRGTVDLKAACTRASLEAIGGSYAGEAYHALPALKDVPVAWPGVGAFTIGWALAAGDTGVFIPTSEDAGKWWSGEGAPAEPASPGRNGLYGVFVPGMPKKAKVPSGVSATGVVMVSAKFMLTSSAGAAEKALALAEKVNTELGKIKDALSVHTHQAGTMLICAGSGSPATGYTGPAGIAPGVPDYPYTNTAVDSTKVFTNG